MQSDTYHLSWGGLLETLENLEDHKEVEDKIKNLRETFALLENSKNLEELKKNISCFSEEESPSALGLGHSKWVEYLNSPLLDEICDTIQEKNPFLECCRKNKISALQFYLKREEFVEKNNGLVIASQRGYKEIVEILLKLPGIYVNTNNNSSLKLASYFNRKDVVKLLLRNNAPVTEDCLKFAICTGNNEIVELLLEEAMQKQPSPDLNRLLFYACENEQLFIVNILLKKGANTLTQALSFTMNTDILKLLVEKGANIHDREDILLRTASMMGYKDTVEFALQHGADVHVMHDRALKQACIEGHLEIARILLQHGASIHNPTLEEICLRGNIEMVKLLLEHGLDIHANNNTSLYHAVIGGHYELVKFLLETGASISFTRGDSSDVFNNIIREGELELLKLFLKYTKFIEEYLMEKYISSALESTTDNKNEILTLLIEYSCK